MSTLNSILHCKCPKCHKGAIFVTKKVYTFRAIISIHPQCQVCGQDFLIEPGFYLGAMWISYPFVLISFIGIIIGLYFLSDKLWISILLSLFIEMLLMPIFLRVGRSAWLHLNV